MNKASEKTASLIRETFCPVVAVLSSYDAEALCHKNHLSFTDMLMPFSQLTTEIAIKEPTNQSTMHSIQYLRVDFRDLRKDGFLLGNSVLPSVLSEILRSESPEIGEDLPKAPNLDENLTATGPGVSGKNSPCPWYTAYRDGFLRWAEPAEHEFLRNYLACILVVSTNHLDPLDQLTKLSQSQHAQQHLTGQSAPSLADVSGGPTYAATPKWFLPNIFKYHVLAHDVSGGDDKKAESVYQSMKMQYGAHACHLLRINSGDPKAALDVAIPDPWKSCLNSKYRGFHSGLRLAKRLGYTTGSPNRHSGSTTGPNTPTNERPEMTIVNGEPILEEIDEEDEFTDKPVFQVGNEAANGTVVPKPRAYRSESIPHALSSSDLTTMSNNLEESGHVISMKSSTLSPNRPPGPLENRDNVIHGQLLTTSDRDRIKVFVQEFASRGLAAFVERQMRLLNEQVVSRKGIHKSLFSATKKWLAGSSAATPNPAAQAPPPGAQGAPGVAYADSSGEMQVRRLADLSFLFQHYQLAYQLYQTLKRDFAADHAWLCYAGALEMATVCAFLLGPSQTKAYPAHYMDTALNTYMNTCGKPLLGTRATFLSSEMLCSMDMQSEAANHFIRMTSGDSDLCSALFLEQASFAFQAAKMRRKYALHMILAGHRYSKAGHRPHSLRCYQLAGEVYAGKGWGLAEDHIHFTVGHQALALKRKEDASKARGVLLRADSQQYPNQQEQFFRDYLGVIQELSKETPNVCRNLQLPMVNSKNVTVFLGGNQADWTELLAPEEDDVSEYLKNDPGIRVPSKNWLLLEDCCSEMSSANSIPNISPSGVRSQRASPAVLNRDSDNSKVHSTPAGERWVVAFPIRNPLELPIVLVNAALEGSVVAAENSSCGIVTQVTEKFVLGPNEEKEIRLSVIPTQELIGKCVQITGWRFGLAPLRETGDIETSLLVNGRQDLVIKGKRLNATKEQRQMVSYGADYRLRVRIAQPQGLLNVELKGRMESTPSAEVRTNLTLDCLCGELRPYDLNLENRSGTEEIRNVKLISDPLEGICVTETEEGGKQRSLRCTKRPPALSAKGNNPVSQNSSLRPWFWQLVGTGGGMKAGARRNWVMWIRAPAEETEITLKLLVYYESKNGRHRTCRRRLRIRTHASLHLKCRCCPGTSTDSLSDDIIRVRSDVSGAGTASTTGNRALGVLNVQNGNRTNDQHITEVSVLRLACVSAAWKMDGIVSEEKEVKLNPSEVENVCFSMIEISKSTNQPASVVDFPTVSERWLLAPSIEIPTEIDGNPGHVTSAVLPWPPLVEWTAQEAQWKRAACMLAVLWKAHVVKVDGAVQTVFGEQWTKLPVSELTTDDGNVGGLISPSIEGTFEGFSLSNSGWQSPLFEESNFHRRFESQPEPSGRVTCDISSQSSVVQHDFSKNRFCSIPVSVQVRYALDDDRELSLSTARNTASRNSSPAKPRLDDSISSHYISVTLRCYTGLPEDANRFNRAGCAPLVYMESTARVVRLTPRGAAKLEFSACVTMPGVYDMSSIDIETETPGGRKDTVVLPSRFVSVVSKGNAVVET